MRFMYNDLEKHVIFLLHCFSSYCVTEYAIVSCDTRVIVNVLIQ